MVWGLAQNAQKLKASQRHRPEIVYKMILRTNFEFEPVSPLHRLENSSLGMWLFFAYSPNIGLLV